MKLLLVATLVHNLIFRLWSQRYMFPVEYSAMIEYKIDVRLSDACPVEYSVMCDASVCREVYHIFIGLM